MTDFPISDLAFISPMTIESHKFEIGASLARSSAPNFSAAAGDGPSPPPRRGWEGEGRGGAMLGPRAARISRPMTATVSTSSCTSHELKPRSLVSRVLLCFLSFFFNLFPVPVPVARGAVLGTPRRKWRSGTSPARRSW